MATFPNVNAANKYARDVVAGKIPNCREVILACQRHLDELAKEKDPNFQFRFDKAKAERICSFIQKMPHTKGKWASKKLKLYL